MKNPLMASPRCKRCKGSGVVTECLDHALLTHRTICRCVQAESLPTLRALLVGIFAGSGAVCLGLWLARLVPLLLLVAGCSAEFRTAEGAELEGGAAGAPGGALGGAGSSSSSGDLDSRRVGRSRGLGGAPGAPAASLDGWTVVGAGGLELEAWEGAGGSLCATPEGTAWWGWPGAGPGLELEQGDPLGLAWELEAGAGVVVAAHVGPAPDSSGPVVFSVGPLPPGSHSFAFTASSALDSAGVALRVDGAGGRQVCLLAAQFEAL